MVVCLFRICLCRVFSWFVLRFWLSPEGVIWRRLGIPRGLCPLPALVTWHWLLRCPLGLGLLAPRPCPSPEIVCLQCLSLGCVWGQDPSFRGVSSVTSARISRSMFPSSVCLLRGPTLGRWLWARGACGGLRPASLQLLAPPASLLRWWCLSLSCWLPCPPSVPGDLTPRPLSGSGCIDLSPGQVLLAAHGPMGQVCADPVSLGPTGRWPPVTPLSFKWIHH